MFLLFVYLKTYTLLHVIFLSKKVKKFLISKAVFIIKIGDNSLSFFLLLRGLTESRILLKEILK